MYAILIDAPQAQAAQATAFWSAALGFRAEAGPPYPQFIALHDALPGLVTAVQAVDDAPRVHLDFETDDVEAETGRLLALGATEVAQWQECRVLTSTLVPSASASADNGTRRGRSTMSEDRGHIDRLTDEEIELTDEEIEVLRHVRFGKLPARVAPADLVETAETGPPHEEPEQPPVRREWG